MQRTDASTPTPTTPTWAPPLDVALTVARQTLADLDRLDASDPAPYGLNATVWHLHGTAGILDHLTDAVRADGQTPGALVGAEGILATVDQAGFTVELLDAGRLLRDVITATRALIDAANSDEDEVRIPGQRPPSPDSADRNGWQRHTAEDRPPLPMRRIPHEDDGRTEQPDTARPHPQLVGSTR